MEENSIRIISFTGEKGKWYMWLGKLMARDVIKGCGTPLTYDKKILADDADTTEDEVSQQDSL